MFRTNHEYGTAERSLFIFPLECKHRKNCLNQASVKGDTSAHMKMCNFLRTETAGDLIALKQKAEVSFILILFTLIFYNNEFSV